MAESDLQSSQDTTRAPSPGAVALALLGGIAAAYAAGWVQASAYYRSFGASWVGDWLSASEQIQFGLAPLFGLGVACLLLARFGVPGGLGRGPLAALGKPATLAAVTGALLLGLFVAYSVVGERDSDPRTTRLPAVQLRNDSPVPSHVLLARGGLFLVADLVEGRDPAVRLIDYSRIARVATPMPSSKAAPAPAPAAP